MKSLPTCANCCGIREKKNEFPHRFLLARARSLFGGTRVAQTYGRNLAPLSHEPGGYRFAGLVRALESLDASSLCTTEPAADALDRLDGQRIRGRGRIGARTDNRDAARYADRFLVVPAFHAGRGVFSGRPRKAHPSAPVPGAKIPGWRISTIAAAGLTPVHSAPNPDRPGLQCHGYWNTPRDHLGGRGFVCSQRGENGARARMLSSPTRGPRPDLGCQLGATPVLLEPRRGVVVPAVTAVVRTS